MNSAASVERRIAEMLAEEAFARAPEGTLAAVLERVDDVPQRRRSWPTSRPSVSRLDVRTRWIIGLAAALLVAGLVVAGALLLRPPEPLRDGSSLVIIERQAFTEGAPPTTVAVLAVAPDGSERTLMSIQPDQLDGAYSEWYAGLTADGYLIVPTMTAGGSSIPAVLDLRDPGAQAVIPDAEGAMPKVGPDGRLAMSQNDGRIAIFDPATAATTWIQPGAIGMLERDFGPVWTVDGGLMTRDVPSISTGSVDLVELDLRTMARSPGARPYYAGLGARRVDATGRLLRCDVATDDDCEGPVTLRAVGDRVLPVVWTQDDPAIRVADFAWAIDGGIWLLTETVADGPRTVALLHIDTAGERTVITTFPGSADDPDPGAYSKAARFAALSTDDARIVVEVTGQPYPELWSVDPRAERSTRLPDGIVAGWLAPTSLTRPRPAVQRQPDLPADLRGVWVRDDVVVEFRRRVILFKAGGSVGPDVSATVNASGALEIVGRSGRCGAALATYRWSVDVSGLRLEAGDEPCAERKAFLEGSFERAFSYPDTGSAVTVSGATYVAAVFERPFRITMPFDRSTVVDSNVPARIGLSTMVNGEYTAVAFLVPKAGFVGPCSNSPTRTPFEGDRDVQSYLDGLVDVRFEPAGTVSVGSIETPVVRPVARDPNACPEIALFWTEGLRPSRLPAGTRFAIVRRGDVDVVVQVYGDSTSAEAEGWLRQLLGSVEWLP